MTACSGNNVPAGQSDAQSSENKIQSKTDSDSSDLSSQSSAESDSVDYEINERTVLFKNTQGWGNEIYLHYWSVSDKSYTTTWPGEAMKSVGNNVYSFEVPEKAEYIIINDGNGVGKNQTEEIPYNPAVHKYQAASQKNSQGKYYVEDWNGDKISAGWDGGGTYENDTETAQADRTNKAVKYFESEMGTANLAKYKRNDIDATSLNYKWDTSKSGKPVYEMPLDVSFDGLTIKEGDSVSKLTDAGFVLTDADQTIQPEKILSSFPCKNEKTGRNNNLVLGNKTTSSKKAKDCEIYGVYFYDYNGVKGVNYQGLTEESSLSDIIDKLGLPDGGFLIQCTEGNDPRIKMNYGVTNVEFEFIYYSMNDKASLCEMKISPQ